MEQESTWRTLTYIFLVASFFGVVFILDSVFGLRYEPDEHLLNGTKEQKDKDNLHVHHASLDVTPESKNEAPSKIPEDSVNAVLYIEQSTTREMTTTNAAEEGDKTYFQNLEKRYQQEILSKLPARKSRTDVTIRYYKHPPDGQSAYALQKLGFYIHERPVDASYEDFQSNAIFYGDSVRIEDLQLVAYTLLREGLPLKSIARSRFSNNWKSHSIEIGADTTLQTRKTLTLSDIRNLQH